jgi:hypothetical protein
MLDIVGKRFLGYLVTLAAGLGAARFIQDGVQLEHFYSFSTTLFGCYVAGQSVSDSVAFLKGIKTLVRG